MMKKIFMTVCSMACLTTMAAQDLSKVKVVSDSLFLDNKTYVSGNKYQRDAMLFVDVIADTHPYYIKPERRDSLFRLQDNLLKACGECSNDSVFVGLLVKTLGPLHDKHTDVIDLARLSRKKNEAAQGEALRHAETSTRAAFMDRSDVPFRYVIVPEHSLCYLQFNQCVDARTAHTDTLPRWDTMLDEMFAKMKAGGIKALVVDAQYNNGGSSMLCDELLIHLRPLSEIRNMSSHLRFSRIMAAYNPRVGIAKKSWEDAGHIDELYPMPAGKVGPSFVQPEVYQGMVIFVQGERTYSSAGILMTLARDNHIGMIVGEKSTYSPSHYGEVIPFRLPNTGVLGTVCSKFFARPDKEHVDDTCLLPDVMLDLKDKDAAWQRIIQLVKTHTTHMP